MGYRTDAQGRRSPVRAHAPGGRGLDAPGPVSLVRSTRRDRVPLRGPSGTDVPGGSRGALGRGVGGLPLHARQPEGTVPGTLVPHGGMPALVQRRARHGDASVRRDVPSGRGAAGMTGRRVDVGGAWIDWSRPIGFTFDGRELTAFEGDTLARALL